MPVGQVARPTLKLRLGGTEDRTEDRTKGPDAWLRRCLRHCSLRHAVNGSSHFLRGPGMDGRRGRPLWSGPTRHAWPSRHAPAPAPPGPSPGPRSASAPSAPPPAAARGSVVREEGRQTFPGCGDRPARGGGAGLPAGPASAGRGVQSSARTPRPGPSSWTPSKRPPGGAG